MLKRFLLASVFFFPSIAFAQRFGTIRSGDDVSITSNTILNTETLEDKQVHINSATVQGQFQVLSATGSGFGYEQKKMLFYVPNSSFANFGGIYLYGSGNVAAPGFFIQTLGSSQNQQAGWMIGQPNSGYVLRTFDTENFGTTYQNYMMQGPGADDDGMTLINSRQTGNTDLNEYRAVLTVAGYTGLTDGLSSPLFDVQSDDGQDNTTGATSVFSINHTTATLGLPLYLSDYDCSGNVNSGKLTVDANGLVSCGDDLGSGSGGYWVSPATSNLNMAGYGISGISTFTMTGSSFSLRGVNYTLPAVLPAAGTNGLWVFDSAGNISTSAVVTNGVVENGTHTLTGPITFSTTTTFVASTMTLTDVNMVLVGTLTVNGVDITQVGSGDIEGVTVTSPVTGGGTSGTVNIGLEKISLSTGVTGTLADGSLSSNVPLLNATQTFSGANTFSGAVVMSSGTSFNVSTMTMTDVFLNLTGTMTVTGPTTLKDDLRVAGLSAGTSQQVLTSAGPDLPPYWATATGGGGGSYWVGSATSPLDMNGYASTEWGAFTSTNPMTAGSFISSGPVNARDITASAGVVASTLTVSGVTIFNGTTTLNAQLNLNGSAGTNTQFLRSGGSGAPPVWATPSGSGDAVLSATQTWSGANTFQSSSSFTGPILANLGVGTSAQVLTSAGPGLSPYWSSSSGGSKSPKEYWWPASATLPLQVSESIATVGKSTGTNIDQMPVQFDQSTDECRTVNFSVPSDVDTSATVTFRLNWFSTNTATNNVMWYVSHNSGVGEGTSPDQALTTEAASADAAQGTARAITVTTWTETVSNLGWAANDQVDMQVCRDANNASDTMAGDAYMTGFRVDIPRS